MAERGCLASLHSIYTEAKWNWKQDEHKKQVSMSCMRPFPTGFPLDGIGEEERKMEGQRKSVAVGRGNQRAVVLVGGPLHPR